MIKTHMNNMKNIYHYVSCCCAFVQRLWRSKKKVVVKGCYRRSQRAADRCECYREGHARFRFNHRHERSLLHNHGTLPPVRCSLILVMNRKK